MAYQPRLLVISPFPGCDRRVIFVDPASSQTGDQESEKARMRLSTSIPSSYGVCSVWDLRVQLPFREVNRLWPGTADRVWDIVSDHWSASSVITCRLLGIRQGARRNEHRLPREGE